MKWKTLKKGMMTMVLAAMLCTVPAQGVFAAESINMAYTAEKSEWSDLSDEEYARLCSLTQGTTMTIDGTVADDAWNLNLDGSGSLYVTFENLPEGFSNKAYFEATITLAEEGDYDNAKLCISNCFWDNNSSARLYFDLKDYEDENDFEIPFDLLMDASAGALFLETLQNGVTYDIGATMDAIIAHASVDSPALQEVLNHFKTSQVIKKEIFVGIDYTGIDCTWGITWSAQEPTAETTQEIAETVEETIETTEENQETVYVQPEVTQGDLVYTVKAGDTLGSISANYYGDNSKAGAIRSTNKEAFAAAKGKLTEGMQLILPEKLGHKARIAAPTANAGETLYTVMHGDTLCKIAKAHYGTEKKIAEIFARNSDRLSDSSKLFPGQVIVLPAN